MAVARARRWPSSRSQATDGDVPLTACCHSTSLRAHTRSPNCGSAASACSGVRSATPPSASGAGTAYAPRTLRSSTAAAAAHHSCGNAPAGTSRPTNAALSRTSKPSASAAAGPTALYDSRRIPVPTIPGCTAHERITRPFRRARSAARDARADTATSTSASCSARSAGSSGRSAASSAASSASANESCASLESAYRSMSCAEVRSLAGSASHAAALLASSQPYDGSACSSSSARAPADAADDAGMRRCARDATCTMRPAGAPGPRRPNAGSRSSVSAKCDKWFTKKVASIPKRPSSARLSNGLPSRRTVETPALFTRMSSTPKRSSKARANASTLGGSARSSGSTCARAAPCAFRVCRASAPMRSASAAPLATSRQASTTVAPRAASCSAVSSPKPDVGPVTIATRPVRSADASHAGVRASASPPAGPPPTGTVAPSA
mmetsp:Transcript_15993/g.49827  ORF Transcript_15993/g.49827 Transcript_15993/m.49827 type:complete len:439 (-) Transcript_15993:114-1430(-)